MTSTRFGRLFATAATFFLAAGSLVMAPTAQAAPPGCLVVDTNLDSSYSTLQDAVDAADPGDLLFVKGTCAGTTTLSKNLTITGHSNSHKTSATLDGGGEGPVLHVSSGVAITINDLTITNGDATSGGGISNNGGTVTLYSSSVSNNTASGDGGGIWNRYGGTVTLYSSSVSNNTASGAGGGILSWSSALTLNNSTVSGNTASAGGGGIRQLYGTMTLNNSTISGNATDGSGGGISDYGGALTLNGASTISYNTATGSHAGGGIAIWCGACGGVLTLNDSSTITFNTAWYGGGIAHWSEAQLNNVNAGAGGNVYDNTPDNLY